MSQETKLVNFAKNFKKVADKNQKLFQFVKDEIEPRMDKKMQEFYTDVEFANMMNKDRDYCMRKFIKMTIDGKVMF